jgi:hypothetical protein
VAEVAAAILCDFAQVREGLLFVASGGVDRFFRDDLPGPMGVYLALLLTFGPDEVVDQVHEIRASIQHISTGDIIASADGALEIGRPADVDPTAPLTAPAVIPLAGIALRGYGRHEVSIAVNSGRATILSFTVFRGTPAPS